MWCTGNDGTLKTDGRRSHRGHAGRRACPGQLAVVMLVVGIIGQVTHTGVFFLPTLVAMVVATLRLWRE